MLVPVGFSIDYGVRPVPLLQAIPGALLLLLMGGATLRAWTRDRWRWAGFCGAWFFILLAPSSSVIPVGSEIGAERRIYLALAGIIVLLVAGARGLIALGRRRFPRRVPAQTAPIVAVVVLLSLLVVTASRGVVFTDPQLLWRQAVRARPENARALNNLASAILDAAPEDPEAGDLLERAVAADSSYNPALFNLAGSYLRRGRLAESEPLLRRVVASDSMDEPALVKLGTVVFTRGDLDDAGKELQRAVRLVPDDPDAHAALGVVYFRQGESERAAAELREALRLDPTNAVARRGVSLFAGGSTKP